MADERLFLVEGMNLQGAGRGGEILAGGQRLGVARAADDQFGAVAADALELCRRADLRHEDGGFLPELHGGIGDRCTMIAA